MRTIQRKTLKEIVNRYKRETSQGRNTVYKVDYTRFKYDQKNIAMLNTKNKKYIFRRYCTFCPYKFIKIYDKYGLISEANKEK